MNKVNLSIALGLSSFLFLLPPITYVAALFTALILVPTILMKAGTYLKTPYMPKASLPEFLLLICLFYFFLCTMLFTNYYLAIKELIILTCSVGLFFFLQGQSYNNKNIVFISIALVCVTVALSTYTLLSVDIFNYELMQQTQVESKNPVGIRLVFSVILLLALLFYEPSLGYRVKSMMVIAIVFAFIALSVLESSRAIIFLLINLFVWLCVNQYKSLMRSFFGWVFLLLNLLIFYILIFYRDQILEYLSGYEIFSLLFFKLEPYIPSINKYGLIDGGAFSRNEFIDEATQIAYIGLSQRPLFGRGPDNSRVLFEEEIGILTNSHNNLFEIGLNYGLIGVLLWYFFFGAMCYKLLKGKKSKYFGVCVGFMTSILAISIISPIYREPDIYVMYALMLCLLAMTNNRHGLEGKLTKK